jgi:hypothetical protein
MGEAGGGCEKGGSREVMINGQFSSLCNAVWYEPVFQILGFSVFSFEVVSSCNPLKTSSAAMQTKAP